MCVCDVEHVCICSGAPAAGADGGQVHGPMADYAWGPQGLDNIISQMLASLDDPGPPPANGDKIALLPMVDATESLLEDCESYCIISPGRPTEML